MFNLQEFIKWCIKEEIFTGIQIGEVKGLSYKTCEYIIMFILVNGKIDFIDILNMTNDKQVLNDKSAIYKLHMIKNADKTIPALFKSLI